MVCCMMHFPQEHQDSRCMIKFLCATPKMHVIRFAPFILQCIYWGNAMITMVCCTMHIRRTIKIKLHDKIFTCNANMHALRLSPCNKLCIQWGKCHEYHGMNKKYEQKAHPSIKKLT